MLSKFKEEIAFQEYKNKSFKNAAAFKGAMLKKYSNIDVNNLYIRIVNYQVKKYGNTLRVRTSRVK